MKNLRSLTPREEQVLDLMKTGKNTKECAEYLGIATGTFNVNVRNICIKLGKTREEILAEVSTPVDFVDSVGGVEVTDHSSK